MHYLFLIPVFLFSAANCFAQGPGGITGAKTVEIPRLPDDITIDGKLDDAIWARAAVVSDFHQMAPFEYAQPKPNTSVPRPIVMPMMPCM